MLQGGVRFSESARVLKERSCISVFVSLWIEKGLGLVVTGFVPSPLGTITDYTPTGPEVAITVGIWALGLLLVTMFYKIYVSVRKG